MPIVINLRPKGVRVRITSLSPEIMEYIEREVPKCITGGAQNIITKARRRIRSNSAKPRQAPGAGRDEEDLALSAYMVAEGKHAQAISGLTFEDAMSNITNIGSRDVRRGLVADGPMSVQAGEDEVRAKVGFALNRATLMELGYWHARGSFFMRGVPFLHEAAQGEIDDIVNCIGGKIKTLPTRFNLTIPDVPLGGAKINLSEEQKMLAEMEAFNAAEAKAAAAEAKQAMDWEWDAFRAEVGTNALRRQNLGKTGRMYRGRRGLIEANRWETAAERLERIIEMFNQWKYGGFGESGMADRGSSSYVEDYIASRIRRGINR